MKPDTWNDQNRVERLRALWNFGHSASEIARLLGVTRNQVIGKAHRMCLAPRPSPIRLKQAQRAP